MNKQTQLVLLTNRRNDEEAGRTLYIEHLLQFLQSQPGLFLTIIETDQPGVSTFKSPKEGNISIISVPGPENNMQLSAAHTLHQITYARRVADILFGYLQNIPGIIFWANSVDHVWLFQALKEHHPHARFVYTHHEWSRKQHLDIADNIFAEYWKSGDISENPQAFELTAYEQKMALIADRVITSSENDSRFFNDVLDIPSCKTSSIPKGTTDHHHAFFQLLPL